MSVGVLEDFKLNVGDTQGYRFPLNIVYYESMK